MATMFTLIIVMMLLQSATIGSIPSKQYEAERLTSLEAVAAFDRLRSMASALATPYDQFTVSFPLGTPAVSPFASPSIGTLRFDPSEVTHSNASYKFVPRLYDARVTKVDQDVILAIDSSGSMAWNDPSRLRISGAKDYVTHLTFPDRVAVVDFDDVARLTKTGCGTAPDPNTAHHLYSPGHAGPNYSEVWSDLDCIDAAGSTNYGDALRIANDELSGSVPV
ncbi:MAG: VWA domain-containing protein [Methanobacteriota archaeon]|nr:MAG: VWA domain-containing protein [Euryarchaeota archaeon]